MSASNHIIASAGMNGHAVDEEEVSLSDSSFISSDDDSSGDDGYEASGMTDTSNGDDSDDIFQIKQSQSMDEFTMKSRSKVLLHRSATTPIQDASHSTMPTFLPNHNHNGGISRRQKSFRSGGYLDKIPPPMEDSGIPLSLTLSMARQHVQLAHSLLDLLNEKDRQDALRRRNVRHTLLGSGNKNRIGNNDDGSELVEEDGACPLLTLIKAGPVYKLHIKGGKASKKIGVNKSKGGGMTHRLMANWKPKFVEVRKGILSYYNDSPSSSLASSSRKKKANDLVRKNIPLHAKTCVCRAVDYFGNDSIPEDNMPARLYAFELVIQGLPTRLFASGTEAGRQAWIHSICKGMVGYRNDASKSDNDICNRVVGLQQNAEMQKFMELSQAAATAKTAASYVDHFAKPLWGSAITLSISSVWNIISPQLVEDGKSPDQTKFNDRSQPGIQSDLQKDSEEFWNKLQHFNFSLNGRTLRGTSIHGPERAFGALIRSILECDQSLRGGTVPQDANSKEFITEIQAARYTRDVFRVLSSEHKGRVSSLKMAVKALCKIDKDLVEIGDGNMDTPMIKIKVSSKKTKDSSAKHLNSKSYDRREWLHIRKSGSKMPKRRFAVLSVGVLCFYKEALPRPHHLIGQLFLVGAKIGFWEQAEDSHDNSSHPYHLKGKVSQEEGSMMSSECHSNHSSDIPQTGRLRPKYIIFVIGAGKKSKERHLCFTDYDQYSEWRDALLLAVESCSSPLRLGEENPTSMDELRDQQQTPQSTQISPLTSLVTTAFRSFNNFSSMYEADNEGITWVNPPANSYSDQVGTSKTRHSSNNMNISSRILSGETPLLSLFSLSSAPSQRIPESSPVTPTLSAFRIASSRLIMGSESSITSTVSSIPGRAMSVASRHLPKTFQSNNSSNAVSVIDGDNPGSDIMMDDRMPSENVAEPTVELEVQFSTMYHIRLRSAAQNNVVTTIRASCSQRFHLSGGKMGRLTKDQEIIKLDAAKGSVSRNTFESMYDAERRPERRVTI